MNIRLCWISLIGYTRCWHQHQDIHLGFMCIVGYLAEIIQRTGGGKSVIWKFFLIIIFCFILFIRDSPKPNTWFFSFDFTTLPLPRSTVFLPVVYMVWSSSCRYNTGPQRSGLSSTRTSVIPFDCTLGAGALPRFCHPWGVLRPKTPSRLHVLCQLWINVGTA